MSKTKTLLFTGGEIHDYKGVGAELKRILEASGNFEVTHVEQDLNVFASPDLTQYDAIVLFYTIGELTDAQYNGLSNFVKSGKGFVPIHSGADSFQKCPEYRALVGGHFVTHPAYRTYQVSVLDREHEITEGLDEFQATDEQYITDYDPRVNVLATAVWQGIARPVAWTKSWGEGRVFYLALGHDAPACRNEHFELLLTRGVAWAGRRA
ncbi:MAG: ThuA domain-containing protein [Armatimonadetes bacterium]|nr:ThuA domain-containing protein [Armatimonadota bacterium]